MKRARTPAQLDLGIQPVDRRQKRLSEAARAHERGNRQAARAIARYAFNPTKGASR